MSQSRHKGQNVEQNAQTISGSGKITRRGLIKMGALTVGATGATMLVPAPLPSALGAARPYKIGSLQPLSGAAAAGGKTAVIGLQMAADRINKSGGINGRPVELVIADTESKPDVGRRKAEKLWLRIKSTSSVAVFSPTSASPACPCGGKQRSST
jgi:branched-chain amino acid transport system substrate-binding protein